MTGYVFREIFPQEQKCYWFRKQQTKQHNKEESCILSLNGEKKRLLFVALFVLSSERERRTRTQNEDDVVHNHHFLRVVFFPRSTEDFDEKKIDSIFLDGVVFVIFRKR